MFKYGRTVEGKVMDDASMATITSDSDRAEVRKGEEQEEQEKDAVEGAVEAPKRTG